MQERSERTRERLLRAGAELFNRKGYANATLGDIARAAGVTKGALYFHFSSKEDLADAVQERGCALLGAAVRELTDAGFTPLQTLIDLTYWLARGLREEPAVRAGFRITSECSHREPPVTDVHGVWISTVWELLRKARETGELRYRTRWEGPETLVAAAVCGIEVMSGTGMSYGELRHRVGAMWDLMLPSLMQPGTELRMRTWPIDGYGAGDLDADGYGAERTPVS